MYDDVLITMNLSNTETPVVYLLYREIPLFNLPSKLHDYHVNTQITYLKIRLPSGFLTLVLIFRVASLFYLTLSVSVGNDLWPVQSTNR